MGSSWARRVLDHHPAGLLVYCGSPESVSPSRSCSRMADGRSSEETRRVTAMVESMQLELEDMRVGRAQERQRPDVRPERKAATEGETRRGVQPDAAKRAKSASAKSAERKGRDASSQNKKFKKTLKYRGDSDKSESDSSSGSSDPGSDHSDSNSFEDLAPNVPTVADPERFHSIAVQGGWTDKVKIYDMKLKLSTAVRNWRANLRSKVRRDWKKFLKALREMYCKAKTAYSERYYPITQRKSESPLEFYYRLNKVADKADIDFDSSSKQRERHLKVFTKKLLDSRLRTTLQGQRIRKLRDLEYVLKQHEEMAHVR
ncbi:unnamed protein product [Phytophthora fragariaefolia]|uniref:Unnamed protein product n=1 Tax=Phytophthora fragariaefolia TaxID=1490495 RepID=A0A9W7CWE8_9STRA|nr:unnamed protein product [Phytophthora fragariaefolia]